MKFSEAIASMEKDLTVAGIERPHGDGGWKGVLRRRGGSLGVFRYDARENADVKNAIAVLLGEDDLSATDWRVIETCPHQEGTCGWASWQARHGKTVESPSAAARMVPNKNDGDGWAWRGISDHRHWRLGQTMEALDWRIVGEDTK